MDILFQINTFNIFIANWGKIFIYAWELYLYDITSIPLFLHSTKRLTILKGTA